MENNRSSVSPPMIILGPRQAPAAPAQQQPSQLVPFQQLYQPASQHPNQQVPQQTTTVPQQIPQQLYQQAPRQLYQQAIQQPYQQKQPQPVYQPQQISLQTYQQQMPSQIYQQQLPQRTFSGQVSQQQQQIPQQAYRQLPQQSHQPLPQLQVQQFGQQQQQQQKQQPLLIQCYRFDDFDGDLSSLVVANGNNRPSSVAVNSTGNSANNANSQKRPRQSRVDDYVQDYEEEDSNDDEDDSADEDSNSDDESEPELDAPISQLLTSHRQGSHPAPSLAVQSAYALFFKDTLPQVKRDQPAMAFGEASQAIERMWQRLGQAGKAAYAKRSSALRSNKPYSLPVPVNLGHRPQQQLHEPQYQLSEVVAKPKAKPAKVQPKTQRKPKQHQQSAEVKKAKRLKKEKQEKQKNLPIKKPKVITEEAGFCARHGCSKPAVDHPQWDGEYCSADCCLLHVGQVRLLFAGMSAAGHTLSAS
ncbi:hypothetical protein BOX15_Mlig018335g2 [Macrostomum lignano]|uniref:HMG box domain-containing protein n=1 Tax=Macrostomum lignano TaxID=282301 RepID=A0A267DLY8_9PLAT|nr:hypothetical protein BOX15_Mlig018335g2 [Macrostomum lignano]